MGWVKHEARTSTPYALSISLYRFVNPDFVLESEQCDGTFTSSAFAAFVTAFNALNSGFSRSLAAGVQTKGPSGVPPGGQKHCWSLT